MDEAIELGEESGRGVGGSGAEEAMELGEESGHALVLTRLQKSVKSLDVE